MGLFDAIAVLGKSTKEGNYDIEVTCPKGHTYYKKRGDTSSYKCPMCGRGKN
jgi:PHP family Zn ribbon phosphoesterase